MSLFVLFVLFVVNSKPRPSTDGGPKVSHLLGDAQRLKVTAMKTPRSSVGHAPYLIESSCDSKVQAHHREHREHRGVRRSSLCSLCSLW